MSEAWGAVGSNIVVVHDDWADVLLIVRAIEGAAEGHEWRTMRVLERALTIALDRLEPAPT